MKKNAIVSVSSRIDNDDKAIEVVTPGEFYDKENSYYAIYKETELSGMEGTTTTLKISKDKFSLIRMGTTTTKMQFQQGKEDISLYSTPYGVLEVKIFTDSLKINIDENGGDVVIAYSMEIAGHQKQSTELVINIKTKN